MWSASLLQFVAKGIGRILRPRATREVGLSRHLEVETQSSEEVLVVEVVAVVGHSVAQKLVHIGAAVAVSTDQETIAILQVHLDLVEIGCAPEHTGCFLDETG